MNEGVKEMSVWEDWSPDFEDAYDRFQDEVEDEPIFNEWVNKFNDWINEGRTMRDLPPIQPTLKQIRALAYHAHDVGIEDLSIQVAIPDRRYKVGYRMGYRDVKTGEKKKNPYKEREAKEKEKRTKNV
jgi:hypothetical protein